MSANTTRLGLTYPQNSDAPNGASQVQTLATQLDGLVNGFYSGTAANRSSVVTSPTQGVLYYATDTTILSYYNGSAWVNLGPVNTSAGNIAALAFGNSAAAGSTGLAADAAHVHAMPSGAGQLLGTHQYAPGSFVSKTISTGLPSLGAVDTTNLVTPSFTAPASGQVLVRLNFTVSASTSTVYEMWFGLFQHSTTTQVGYTYSTTFVGSSTTNTPALVAEFLVSSLTPTNSYQFDLAAATSVASVIYCSGLTAASIIGSPFLATVWQA